MEAIVLAGGFGTRLQSVVSDLPKPMAPIKGQPFLRYVLEYLLKNNIKKVVLSTGYKHEEIHGFFGNAYKNIELCYSHESEPLGTGGAIMKALSQVHSDKVFVLNGDTYFDVELSLLMELHLRTGADLSMALKKMTHFDRYGVVCMLSHRVKGFSEKKYTKDGLINGGVYLLNVNLFDQFTLSDKFSFEADFMEQYLNTVQIVGLPTEGYFIDIGIPEDYRRAQHEMEDL